MQKWPPGQAPMVRRNRAFLWSLASTVYPGTLWLHTIEMGDASIQASNHLLCTVCICGFTQPNIELLHAFSLATESLVLRNEPGSKLQPSNHLLMECLHGWLSWLWNIITSFAKVATRRLDGSSAQVQEVLLTKAGRHVLVNCDYRPNNG